MEFLLDALVEVMPWRLYLRSVEQRTTPYLLMTLSLACCGIPNKRSDKRRLSIRRRRRYFASTKTRTSLDHQSGRLTDRLVWSLFPPVAERFLKVYRRQHKARFCITPAPKRDPIWFVQMFLGR